MLNCLKNSRATSKTEKHIFYSEAKREAIKVPGEIPDCINEHCSPEFGARYPDGIMSKQTLQEKVKSQ